MRLSSLSYRRVPPPRTCISATRGSIEMDKLAKYIEQSLKERGFCIIFEDELERCWPIEKIDREDREKQIQTFAKSRGWIVSILNTDSGMRAIFEPHSRKGALH